MARQKVDNGIISAGDISATSLQRWHFPSFDEKALNVIAKEEPEPEPEQPELTAEEELAAVEVEEVEIEEVQPLTIEEVEAVRQDAYNEGFSAGEKDGFHAGQIKAQQEAQAALEPRLQALEQIMQQLFTPIAEQDQQLEAALLSLVQNIAAQVIQRELQLDSSQISKVLREALKLLPVEGEQIKIFLNPQDFEQIKQLRERHEENWRILEDESLQAGGCRVESGSTRIDASLETRIQTLTKQLLEQQRTQFAEPVAPDIEQEFDLTPAPLEQIIAEPESEHEADAH